MDYSLYASFYDAEYADYTPEVPFFIKLAKRLKGHSLELGCGTGRVLLELAKAGCPVDGIEKSEPMLDLLAAKLTELPEATQEIVELYSGDMCCFKTEKKYSLIYMPFREFMHLESVSEQLDCLRCMRSHLAPNGRVVINLYDVDLTLIAGQTSEDVPLKRQKSGDFVDPETGHKVLLSSASVFRWAEQTLVEERFYDRIDTDGEIVQRKFVELRQRWFTRFELHHLFHRCGFRVESWLGGYNGQKKIEPGGESIWILRPASNDEIQDELNSHSQNRALLT
jgi:SAM-dependent methyltransferase